MINYTILREITFKITIEIMSSDVIPKESFLFREDIDNQSVYVNVCSLDDLTKWNPTTHVFFTSSKVEKQCANIEEMETFLSDIEDKLTSLQSDYQRYLDENKIGQLEQKEIA